MYSHDYDGDYYPSAPVIEISIRTSRHKDKLSPKFMALVDSGADATMIPRQ